MAELELSPEVQEMRDMQRQAEQLRVSMGFELFIHMMAKVDARATNSSLVDEVIKSNVDLSLKAVDAFVKAVEA